MRINGAWHLCDDDRVRPVVTGEIAAADGNRQQVTFLLDIGADRTVLSADILRSSGLAFTASPDRLGGVGGTVDAVTVDTQIVFLREDGGTAVFKGRFAAFTDPKALDMSVLGRDITNLFAVIVDRPQDIVCMLGQRHRYVIQER